MVNLWSKRAKQKIRRRKVKEPFFDQEAWIPSQAWFPGSFANPRHDYVINVWAKEQKKQTLSAISTDSRSRFSSRETSVMPICTFKTVKWSYVRVHFGPKSPPNFLQHFCSSSWCVGRCYRGITHRPLSCTLLLAMV